MPSVSHKNYVYGHCRSSWRHKNFNDKILMKRVTTKRYVRSLTSHINFSDVAIINTQIKEDKWRDLVDVTMKIDENFRYFFRKTYLLEKNVVDRMEFFTKQK